MNAEHGAQKWVVANWKMHMPPHPLPRYMSASACGRGARVIICPPYPYLKEIVEGARKVCETEGGARLFCGAQQLSAHAPGSHTGEVCGEMLQDCGAQYVLVGHSERRRSFAETDVTCAQSIVRARACGLIPIVCLGEGEAQKKQKKAFLTESLGRMFGALQPAFMLIAYEPVWAIGASAPATCEEIASAHQVICERMCELWGAEQATHIPVLYGGSLSPQNAADIFALPQVQGGLVGRASLDPLAWRKIIEALL